MKRHLSGAAAATVVLALAVLGTACDVTPPAASANGTAITTDTLNTQLHTLQATAAGNCLLQLQNAQITPLSAAGAGGRGTFAMPFAVSVLDNQVGDLLAEQYAASKGISLSSSDLAAAKPDFESTLNGEIAAAVQQTSSSGTASYCQDPTGASLTGAALLSGLPEPVRAAQIRNEAVDEKLLARGADLSDAAVAAYYAANLPLFTAECVSVIATDTQAHAEQLIAQLNAGAAFADVARASSLDSQTAANGGSLGCNYTEARVEQALQQQSIAVGRPLGPLQDTSTGQWVIYEVTNRTVEPLSAAASVVRRELLQATPNVTRVSKEIVGFARHSDVWIDPTYGTWKALTIVAPVAPPEQYLLAGASGDPPGPTGSTGSTGLPGTSVPGGH
jgi:hypothetical protein